MEWLTWVRLFTVAALIIWTSTVVADELPRESVLPLALATKAASTALDTCTKNGYKVTAAVVDKTGVLRVQLRADGAGAHTVDSSRKKAYTAASLGRSTSELAELVAKTPQLHALGKMNDNILLLGGGLPIKFGTEVVGGIGVGGAPGAHLDEACAQAGLVAIGATPMASPTH